MDGHTHIYEFFRTALSRRPLACGHQTDFRLFRPVLLVIDVTLAMEKEETSSEEEQKDPVDPMGDLQDSVDDVRRDLDRDRATTMSLLRVHATDLIELTGSLGTLRVATLTFFAITAVALGITYVAQYPKRGESDTSCREELIQVRTGSYSGNEALRVQCPHPDQYLARAIEIYDAKTDLGVYACRCKNIQELTHQNTKLSILFQRMEQFDKAVEKSGEIESAEKRMMRMEAVRKVAEAVAGGDFQMSDSELEALGLKKPEDPPETKPKPNPTKPVKLPARGPAPPP